MKWLTITAVILAFAIGALFADISGPPRRLESETSIGTDQYDLSVLRTVTTNDTSLLVTTDNWEDIKAVFIPIPPQFSTVMLQFYAYGDGTGPGSPDGGTFDFAVYVAKRFGNAVAVCSANDAVVGKSQLSTNPMTGAQLNDGDPNSSYCWVDTFTLAETWITAVVDGDNAGADRTATVAFDPLGYSGIYVYITDMSSVTSVSVVMTGCGG